MHWADSIAKALSHRGDKQVIASGITPSGEFHIGHLREILSSDIIKRACQRLGLDTEFVFFVDDADPLRKVYAFLDESYEQYIGHQLANIPPPDQNGMPDLARFEQGTSYADHFLQPFIEALEHIGVNIDEIIYNFASYTNGEVAEASRAARRPRNDGAAPGQVEVCGCSEDSGPSAPPGEAQVRGSRCDPKDRARAALCCSPAQVPSRLSRHRRGVAPLPRALGDATWKATLEDAAPGEGII